MPVKFVLAPSFNSLDLNACDIVVYLCMLALVTPAGRKVSLPPFNADVMEVYPSIMKLINMPNP